MPIGSALTAILSFSFCILMLRIAQDAKTWRLWWMDLLGVLDVDTDRAARKIQERQMAMMCHLLFVLLAALCVSCIYWTVDGVREARRGKTVIEHEIDMGREEIEGVRRRFGR